jgi:hypothetical protein
MLEAGQLTTSAQILWSDTGDKGNRPYTASSDTKDGTETFTQGMFPSSLFQNLAPTGAGDRVVFDEYGLL